MSIELPPPGTGAEDWGAPGVSGLYEVDANPGRRKKVKFFGFLRYRNHEIACPRCGAMVSTTAISPHPFIYSYEEA